jgi:hypothetical protein
MFRMPVTGMTFELHDATGEDDLLLLDRAGDPLGLSLELARRLATPSVGGELDAGRLPVSDLEALLLELRRRTFGDVIDTRGRCPQRECNAAIDLSFRISDYLRSHRARKPATVQPLASDPGWFQLAGRAAQFRLVTVEDLAAAAASPDPEKELARRTIRSESSGLGNDNHRREQRAMEQLAPPLSDEIQGVCPECGNPVRFWFDVQRFVQGELRHEAEFLYDDVHQLASRYHWSEEKILALPRRRRMQYVERALRPGGGD